MKIYQRDGNTIYCYEVKDGKVIRYPAGDIRIP